MRATAAALAVALAVAAPGTAAADDRPSTGHLVAAGLAMAPPTYLIATTAHESSHALAAVLLGLEVTSFRLYPGIHPRTRTFYFAWVDVRGITSRGQRTTFLVAPKITDAALLAGYSALIYTDTIPSNRYGRLALAVLATGFWIDFSRDAISWWSHNDTVRIYSQYGLRSEWRRLPFRLVHAGLAFAAALPIARGYRGAFGDDDTATTTIVPLLSGAF